MKFPAPLPLPNRADRSILPALLALILAALIVAQIMMPPLTELDIVAGRTKVPAINQQSVAITGADPVILNRPIFTPSRGASANGSGNSDASNAPMAGAIFAGIVRVRGYSRAVMQRADGDAVSVSVGASFFGWRLISMNDDAATFMREGVKYRAPLSVGGISNNNNFQPSRDFEQ